MARSISDERLEILHEQFSGELRRRKDQEGPIYVEMTIDVRAVSNALFELKQRRKEAGAKGANKLSHITVALMSLKVGESFECAPITNSALTTLRNTARKKLGIPDARWHKETLEDGICKITRMPDGTPHLYGKSKNPAIDVMANMAVGETVILKTIIGKMHNQIKVLARKKMDYAEANWKCENLANGDVRCTRIR